MTLHAIERERERKSCVPCDWQKSKKRKCMNIDHALHQIHIVVAHTSMNKKKKKETIVPRDFHRWFSPSWCICIVNILCLMFIFFSFFYLRFLVSQRNSIEMCMVTIEKKKKQSAWVTLCFVRFFYQLSHWFLFGCCRDNIQELCKRKKEEFEIRNIDLIDVQLFPRVELDRPYHDRHWHIVTIIVRTSSMQYAFSLFVLLFFRSFNLLIASSF